MTDRLDHYIQRWNLTDPELIAQTYSSTVYTACRDNARVVLKLLTYAGGGEDEADGALALRYFGGDGAVYLLAHDSGAHLLEYAGDAELAQLVVRGDDVAAAEIIAATLNKLHHTRPDTPVPTLRTLRRWFRSLFARAAADTAAGHESIYVRGARVAEYLLANPQNECVLHGDIQHHNIRQHPTRGWLAYDPKGLYGERTFDATNALCNPANARERVMSEARLLEISQVIAEGMGVAVGRLRTYVFAYACLSASWEDKPEGSAIQNWFLTVARNAEPHIELPGSSTRHMANHD